MIPLTVQEIADATGARIDGADPDGIVTAVVTDSRAAGPGTLFVALRGEHHDGHSFLREVHERGAVASLVDDDSAPNDAGALLRVADPLTALGAVAAAVRARLKATVVAITGSSGKTCTKEFIAAALATEMRTSASAASYNNEIGVPLTVCSADETTEALVVEVGARGVGHIASLAPIVRPDISVLTNIGTAHLGMFGSIENTFRAKSELVEALGPDGVAILNADDPRLRELAARTQVATITYGTASDADVRAEDVRLDADGIASFTLVWGSEAVAARLRIPGEHMVWNAAAAAAAALAAGVALESAVAGIAACGGPAMRMQVSDVGGKRIINDAYNANPDSMAAALKALAAMGRGRPTWAVLGHMAELGDASVEEHDRIGRLLVRLGVGHIVTVGEEAQAIHEAARLEGMPPGEAVFVRSPDEAVEVLRERLEPDAVVLVKASRSAGLERVAEAIVGGAA